jgi:hypothetical protein
MQLFAREVMPALQAVQHAPLPLIGKKVEIIVRDLSQPSATAEPWDALAALAGQDLVDSDAYQRLRAFDRNQSTS